MTDYEIAQYINVRNGELSSDEILKVIDTSLNTQINHISYENNRWTMWSEDGVSFTFTKRTWS